MVSGYGAKQQDRRRVARMVPQVLGGGQSDDIDREGSAEKAKRIVGCKCKWYFSDSFGCQAMFPPGRTNMEGSGGNETGRENLLLLVVSA